MIHTLKHLAYTLKIDVTEFEKIIGKIDDYYYESKEPKLKDGKPRLNKNGEIEYRIIHPSKGRLKEIQKRINTNILKNIPMPKYAFGAVRGRDNVLHAKYHQGNKHFFNTDLKNFYPSIRHQRVFDFFRAKKFSPDVSSVLTKLTTYKGKLPQGIPTSSYIANLIFETTGNKLNALAETKNMKFTTYIDDVVVSSKSDFKILIPDFLKIITDDGYIISHKKTNYKTKNPEVTGVVVKANNLALANKTKTKFRDETLSEASKNGQLLYIEKIKKINKQKAKSLIKELYI